MMHNTYTSSIISLRTSISYNDYPYSSNQTCPSNCCSCCCSFPINSTRFVVPINPSFLYGFRQSTLIQWPPSRRLILGSTDRFCYGSPIHDVGRHCCGQSCCVKQERIDVCREKCCVIKERSVNVNKIKGRMMGRRRNFRCSALGDAEAMLSLLTGETIEECFDDIREVKRSSFEKNNVVKKQSFVNEKPKNRKENVGYGYLESEPKKPKVGRVQCRDEGARRREEREGLFNGEDRRSNRRESSSSDYSFSDSGEVESDEEVEVEEERYVGGSLSKHGESSRKNGGIIISEGTRKDSKMYRDERDQQVQSSRRGDLRVGSSVDLDWRRKSEQKFTDESEKTKSRKNSVVRQSRLSQAYDNSSLKASSSKQQFDHQEVESTSGTSFHGQSRSRFEANNQASEYSKFSTRHEQSTRNNRNNVEATSSTRRRSNLEDESQMVVRKSVQEAGCESCKTCGSIMEQNKTSTNFQEHGELSEIRDDARLTSTVLSQIESRLRKLENSSTSLQTSVKEENKQRDETVHVATGQINTRKKSQHLSETVDAHHRYVQSILRSQQQSEARMKNLEGSSRSVTSGGEVIKEVESVQLSPTAATASQVHSTNVEFNRQSASGQRTDSEQTYLATKVKLVEELIEKRKVIDETIIRLRTELQGPTLLTGFTGNISGEAAISQPSVTSSSQTAVQQVGEGEVNNDQELSTTSPSYQFMERRSPHSEPSSSFRTHDSGRITEVGASSAFLHSQQGTPSSSNQVDRSESESYEEPSPEDALGSAERLEESSMKIVGEFVEKMRHEASTSEILMEKMSSQVDSKNENKKYMVKGSTEPDDSQRERLQKQVSRRSSGSSLTKGPSDEMWDVKDHFVQEPSEIESVEGAASENVIAKRTGKSLWNIVAGMFQLRWGVRSETQKSPVKAGGKSSSSGSASAEAWFSGNEPDEANVDSMKKEQPQAAAYSEQTLVRRTSIRSQKEDVGVMSSDNNLRHVEVGASSNSEQTLVRRTSTKSRKEDIEVGASSSSSVLQTGSLSGGDSTGANINLNVSQQTSTPASSSSSTVLQTGSLSGVANTNINVTQQTSTSTSSTVLQTGSLSGGASTGADTNVNVTQQTSPSTYSSDILVPPRRRLRRSHAFEEAKEVGQSEGVVSSRGEQREHSIDVKQTGVSSPEVTAAEVKRRKLQRSKQVMQERFEEWEDAYQRDSEQRKIDESFMKEALQEAKKAADSWEVPVGAVLVQNGKVIARGYNLVEELRDSTAHAEMICIKEASNALRTWRLSETTLYVTLEPCPMCAGAILQARIGTLVWGAPNKLLGADGSWIRLFPEGVEGEERSEVREKPAAPVHPFHPKMIIRRGILEAECAEIMQQFFQLRRRKDKKKSSSEEDEQPSCLPVQPHPSKLLHKMHGVFHMFCL